MPTATPTRRHAARRARDVLMALPVLAHARHGVLGHRGASAPNDGEGPRRARAFELAKVEILPNLTTLTLSRYYTRAPRCLLWAFLQYVNRPTAYGRSGC